MFSTPTCKQFRRPCRVSTSGIGVKSTRGSHITVSATSENETTILVRFSVHSLRSWKRSWSMRELRYYVCNSFSHCLKSCQGMNIKLMGIFNISLQWCIHTKRRLRVYVYISIYIFNDFMMISLKCLRTKIKLQTLEPPHSATLKIASSLKHPDGHFFSNTRR